MRRHACCLLLVGGTCTDLGHASMQDDGAGPAAAALADAEPPHERAAKPAGKAGGVYIPPFKLAQMLREADDKSRHATPKRVY